MNMGDPVDVVVLADPGDAAAVRTLIEAMAREGWRVSSGERHLDARCAVLVWSQRSVGNQELAEAGRPFLDRNGLLQIIWEPPDWGFGKPNAIDPPQPFANLQCCIVDHGTLDGQARSVDHFGSQSSECERILSEVAKLADLARPRDAWNARITFNKAWSKQVRVAEYGADGVTLIRQQEIGGPYDSGAYAADDLEAFETTVGRHWRVLETSSDVVLGQIVIDAPEVVVDLPKRGPWPWNRTRSIVVHPLAGGTEEEPGEDGGELPASESDLDSTEHNADPRPEIFISYAREDGDVVHAIVTLLGWEGWRVWWDPKIQLGEDFRHVVAAHIDSAPVVIVLWSPSARASSWVPWEADRARRADKLVELTLGDGPEMVNEGLAGTLIIPSDPFEPRVRDAILERVASRSGLRRLCDGWNAELHLHGWKNQPQRPAVACWEYVDPGTPTARVVRRERFVGTASAVYGTTIGRAWVLGYENTQVPVAAVWISRAEQHVDVPRRNVSREKQLARKGLSSLVNRFTVHPKLGEFMQGFISPTDLLGMFGVPLIRHPEPGQE